MQRKLRIYEQLEIMVNRVSPHNHVLRGEATFSDMLANA